MTLYLIIPPLFGLSAILGVYDVVYYCCITILWEHGVILSTLTVLLGGGGGGELRSNWSDIFSVDM